VPQASPRGTYLAIADALRRDIKGKQPPWKLQSESELMSKHGVSRDTVRRALKVLAEEGLIQSAPGVGWGVVGDAAAQRPLVERLTDLIRTNDLSVGDPFPSESSLCEQFSASRTAVRRSLAQLEGRGLLVAVHGKGRTVRALPDAPGPDELSQRGTNGTDAD
jgi:DNA-binding GntR family transcriptional regulator